MRFHHRILAFFLGSSAMRGANPPSAPTVETASVALYQPEAVVQQRLSSVQELAAYIQQFQAVLGESLQGSKTAETLDVVVVIKPGQRARVWFVSSLPDALGRSSLAGKLQALPAPIVKEGPVAFAICLNLGGVRRTTGPQGFSPPMPEEWRKAVRDSQQPLSVPDGIVERLWRD